MTINDLTINVNDLQLSRDILIEQNLLIT